MGNMWGECGSPEKTTTYGIVNPMFTIAGRDMNHPQDYSGRNKGGSFSFI